MIFNEPLVRGTLIRRYQRFLADVQLESGEEVVVHCPNSGSMLSVDAPGSEVWVSPARNPERKLRYSWELIRVGETLVGINTSRPNQLVADAVVSGQIPELAGYSTIHREVKYGRNSRIDLLLEGGDRSRCFVEVKNVTLKRGEGEDVPVEFPDSVTDRGKKHLAELAHSVREGARATMVFLAQRADAKRFVIAEDIDPGYAIGLRDAVAAGVEVLCYGCEVSTEGIRVATALDHPWLHGPRHDGDARGALRQ